MSDSGHESRREDLAAYLLGALEPHEAAELERHLAGCAECAAQLRWLGPAVQLLGESVERVEPPPALRDRVLGEVRAGLQRPAAGSQRRPLFAGWRPLAGLAAVALLAAAVGGYAVRGGDSDGGATTVAVGKPPAVTAKLVTEGDSATLHLANVHEMPSGRVLEAWVQRDGEVTPVRGLFVPDREGRATAMIPNMRGVEAVMVTAEPQGGSETPTGAPMLKVDIPL